MVLANGLFFLTYSILSNIPQYLPPYCLQYQRLIKASIIFSIIYHTFKPLYVTVTAFLCNSLHIFPFKPSVTFNLLWAKCFATCPQATDIAWKFSYRNTSYKRSANFNLSLFLSAVTVTSLWQFPSYHCGHVRLLIHLEMTAECYLPGAQIWYLHPLGP